MNPAEWGSFIRDNYKDIVLLGGTAVFMGLWLYGYVKIMEPLDKMEMRIQDAAKKQSKNKR